MNITDYPQLLQVLEGDVCFDEHKRIQAVLLQSNRSAQYHFAKVELWRRILIVLADRNQMDTLLNTAKRFFEYCLQRLDIPRIVDKFPELLDACLVPFHNEKQTDRVEAVLKMADEVAQNKRIAGACAKGYLRLLHLRIMFDQGRGASRCWDKIKGYAARYPEDDTLAECLAEAGKEWSQDLMDKRLPKRYRSMTAAVETAFSRHTNASIASDLAGILANEYFLAYRLRQEYPEAEQTMQHCSSALEQLHLRFPEEQTVIRAYSCICSDQHFDRCLFSSICVDEVHPYQAWHEQYPGDQEIAESYAKMLYVRHQYLLRQGDRKEAKRCVQKLTALAIRFPFQADDEDEQWIHSVLRLIQEK